jgi:hypothetical protein
MSTEFQINKVNIIKWVQALRSGEFKQDNGRLAKIDAQGNKSYCCLGVACEVAVRDGLLLDVVEKEGICECCTPKYLTFDGEPNHLPPSVQAWLGLPRPNPRVGILSATELNDMTKMSFDEIADRIEIFYELNELSEARDAAE